MPRARRPRIAFALDARLELLGALLTPPRAHPYAKAVRARFAPFKSHPAAAELARLLARGVPGSLIAEVILLGSERSAGLLTPELASFLVLFQGLAADSGAAAFFRSRRRDHARFAALAKAESEKGQSPSDVSSYLRMPFPDKSRMILAPLLPREFAVNASIDGVELRVRCGSFGREGLTFEYDAFDCCVAHELTHAALAPLIDASREELDARPGSPPRSCRDAGSWSATFEEHLVRAVTLRALKRSGGEKGYEATSRRWSRTGYPYLPWFHARLEAFEGSPKSAAFSSFYPGLLAAFLLESKP